VRVAIVLLFVLALVVLVPVHLWILRVFIFPFNNVSLRIIGAVDDSSAKLFCREPAKTQVVRQNFISSSHRIQFNIVVQYVEYKISNNSMDWIKSESVALSTTSDYTGVIWLKSLKPATSYQFRYVFDDSTSASDTTHSLTTWSSSPSTFTFAFGSCVVRFFPNVGGDMVGYQAIYDQRPDFVLQIGDQIYSDIPKFFGPSTYLPKYRDAVGQKDFQILASNTPIFQMCTGFPWLRITIV